jgi:hypothetical protein
VLVYEADQANRRMADAGCNSDNFIKVVFWLCIQDAKAPKRGKPVGLAPTRGESVAGARWHTKVAWQENMGFSKNVGIRPTQQNGVMPRVSELDLLLRVDPGLNR